MRTLLLSAFLLLTQTSFCQTETIIHAFSNNGTDGYNPLGGLVFDASGHLYGTTQNGGTGAGGTAFELSPSGNSWEETILYDFISGGPEQPESALIFDANGNMYGTSYAGGTFGYGTVYELSNSQGVWSAAPLHGFGGPKDGTQPMCALTLDAFGNLYGTTYLGGSYKEGTMFTVSPEDQGWTESLAFTFGPPRTGQDPMPTQTLTMDSAGNLYGTTYQGGAFNMGTVFEYTPSTKTLTTLFSFAGLNGKYPAAGVIFDAEGNLYGSTQQGGTEKQGVIFELSPSNGKWIEKVLFGFDNQNGSRPGALVFDQGGNLYGTTMTGGSRSGWGTVFKLSPSSPMWTLTTLHFFGSGAADAEAPNSGIVIDAEGNLYGTSAYGGKHTEGTVWEVTP